LTLSGSPKLKWGCSDCRGEKYEDQDIHREARNCTGEHPQNRISDPSAPGLYQCPWQQIDGWVWWVIGLWSEWKAGLGLPWPSIDEAPAYIFEAFRECENAAAEHKNKQQEQSKTKGNKVTVWQNEQ